MYSLWCDNTMDHGETRRDMIVMDPQEGISCVSMFPQFGVVMAHALSISANEGTRCRVRCESSQSVVGIYDKGALVEIENVP